MFTGYKAGKLFGCYCHYIGRSVPCYADITDEAMSCPFCTLRPRVDWLGYCPMWMDTGRPVFVIVRADQKERWEKIPFKGAVRVRRGKEYHAPIILDPLPKVEKYQTERIDRLNPVDILPSLFTLWKCPDLAEEFQRQRGVTLPPPKLPTGDVPKPPPADPVADDEDLSELRKRVAGKRELETMADVMKRRGLFQAPGEAERNGVHHLGDEHDQ